MSDSDSLNRTNHHKLIIEHFQKKIVTDKWLVCIFAQSDLIYNLPLRYFIVNSLNTFKIKLGCMVL